MTGLVDGRPVFLSTLAATRRQGRLALAVTGLSALLFALMVPFAKQPLAPVWGFIPIYESALVISDLVTAALLFGQFAILRSKALLVLAGGYLFTACLAVVHAMTFPGLFAPAGLLGAGPQTTAWLYMLWHAGFPLAVLAYVVQARRPPAASHWTGSVPHAVVGCILLVLALTTGSAVLTTVGRPLLPAIMQGNNYTPAMLFVVGSVWLLSAGAVVALWRRQPRTVLDLWLMVVMCAWVFDIGLSAVFNAGRFDLGFYAGRIYGLLAANFVLIVLTLENGMLYAGLVDAHLREQQKTAELQRLNVTLDDFNQQLQQASRFKSEFLANMAHELRTPLNAVIGFSELLKDEQAGRLLDKQKRFANLIHDSGRHLLSLINDILDLSKVEAGKMSLDLDPVEPTSFLRDCLALFDEAAERRGIRLHFDAAPIRGRLMVDSRKLRQITYNLLSNAVKFTPDGGDITLSVRLIPRSTPWQDASPGAVTRVLPLPDGDSARLLEVVVSDSGEGMRGEDLPQLFEAFQQLRSPHPSKHVGTGLGLALVSRFAALHGGTVGVASTPGQGSHFGVWLPWRASDRRAAESTSGPTTAGSRDPATSRHALIVEDDPKAAELLRLHLESAGFRVRIAADGSQIHQPGAPRPDLITLDILMPGTNGWDLLEQIKQDEELAHVPVVIVSVVADRQRGFALGVSQVIEKPASRQQLLEAVQSALGLGGEPGQARKVLVVDDDPLALDLVSSNLAGADCEVLRAQDGEQAISVAMAQQPDLIILDLMMPGLSGFEVLDRIRSQPAMASVPVLVMSSKTITPDDRERLNGRVLQVMGKQSLDRDHFMAEVGRALQWS